MANLEAGGNMLSEFVAKSDIRGERIDLHWNWIGLEDPRPGLRLVRCQRAYPERANEGICVADLDDLFDGATDSVARVERRLYLPINTEVESSLQMAEVALYFAYRYAEQPERVIVDYYNPLTKEHNIEEIKEVSRVVISDTASAPWGNIQAIEIFVTPGGGLEESAGQVVVRTEHEDGVSNNLFEWEAAGEIPFGVNFVASCTQQTTVSLQETFDQNSGDWYRKIEVEDQGLKPGSVYYYGIYAPVSPGSEIYYSERSWRAFAMATAHFNASEQLYKLMPSVHQYYDEPDPRQRGQGQLRRFLQIFGASLDQLRGLADGLKQRHDVHQVHSKALPHLARWIGWEPDITAPTPMLRADIQQAPEIFRTVGTVPNLRAVVNRVTGWECKIKEFVHNVFLTNAPESIRLWEIWQRNFS